MIRLPELSVTSGLTAFSSIRLADNGLSIVGKCGRLWVLSLHDLLHDSAMRSVASLGQGE